MACEMIASNCEFTPRKTGVCVAEDIREAGNQTEQTRHPHNTRGRGPKINHRTSFHSTVAEAEISSPNLGLCLGLAASRHEMLTQCLALGHRLQGWTIIKTTLGERQVFTGWLWGDAGIFANRGSVCPALTQL